MSIATSEGESDQSGDDGSVPLPPSAESVGLEWRPPPCPEPSRLDDWFLGVARAPPRCLSSRKCMMSSLEHGRHHRSSGSSSLGTLDGGAARGYTEVPSVERSVVMQLCPRTTSTWRGNPLLPSRACRHSSALTGSAYAACGEAASALHAMALLQVHQAKALRDLHEGDHDPGVLTELRTTTDLALRATKVTGGLWAVCDVHHGGPGTPPLAVSGRHEGGRQGTVPECPRVPDRPLRRRGGELCPAVLRCTEADWGNQAHPAPVCSCCLHPAASGSSSVYSSPRAAPCRRPLPCSRRSSLQPSSAVEPAAGQPPRPSRPPPNQAASVGASGPETDDPGMRCLLFRRWWTHHSLPRRRSGAENSLFLFFFRHWP